MPRKASLKTLRKKAWHACSLYVRHRHADTHGRIKCYTCHTVGTIKTMQAGHAIGGRSNAVLFDLEIIRPQCESCNIWKRGNYQIFITKLIHENGLDWWDSKLENSRKIIKYQRVDYERIAHEFQNKI